MKWLWVYISLFTLSRLYHLMVPPPFMDEFLYWRWLQEIKNNNDWLIMLNEYGWEPLGVWLAAWINKIFPDGILSLRLASLLASLMAGAFIFQKISRTAAIFYLIMPLVLVHDRLGLRGDNLVILGTVMIYYGLKMRLVEKKSQFILWAGIGVALGLMSKTTAAALPLVILLSYAWYRPKISMADLAAGAIAAAPVVFFLVTGTLDDVIGKQETFIGGLPFKANLLQFGPWLWNYFSWPVVLLSLAGLIVERRNLILLANLFIPLLIVIFSAKILFPRYLLPLVPIILICTASGWDWLFRQLPKAMRPMMVIFLILPLNFDFKILSDFSRAPLPEIDRWQYITGWPSGYGVKDLVNDLRFSPPALLVVEDNDLLRTGINYYWPGNNLPVVTEPVRGAALVTNIADKPSDEFNSKFIKEYSRPGNKSSLRLWQLE